MKRGYRPAPPPLETNEQLVTGLITVGWAIALIIVVLLRDLLPPGQRWWIWTCTAGFVMGLFGLWYVPRLKRRRTRAAQARLPARANAPKAGTADRSSTPGVPGDDAD